MVAMTDEVTGQPLTPREESVRDLLTVGLSNKEVANSLGISVRTVETHRARIFVKSGVRNVVELVRKIFEGQK